MDIQNQGEAPAIENLKKIITQILMNNSAYDCLSINSSISSIQKSVSLYDAVNILIKQDIQELLIWDQNREKLVWMLTLVDAIRFTTHALKSVLRYRKVDFSDFQKQKGDKGGQMVSDISQCSGDQLDLLIKLIQQKKIEDIISQIKQKSPVKEYIRIKTVNKQSKLSYIILTMIVEKIHRILIEDTDSKMVISVVNFKDIFLYLLKIANQSNITYYSSIDIHSLLQVAKPSNIQINEHSPLWEAFEIMTDRQKSLWITVTDEEGRFKGMVFREDFRGIFRGWHVHYLWMSVGEFIQLKKNNDKGNVPEFRYFQPTDMTRDIIWKVVMTKRNAIVWVNQQNKVQTTIGLMELFNLYLS